MFTIRIVPIPAPDAVTCAARDAICHANRRFLQTLRHPAASAVLALAPGFTSMDDLYDASPDFDALYAAIAERLVAACDCAACDCAAGDCVYVVTGNVLATQFPVIQAAAARRGGTAVVLPGVTPSGAAFPDKPVPVAYPAFLLPADLDPGEPLAVEEIDSRIRAGEVKLRLMEYYPDEWEILLADLDDTGVFTRSVLPLYLLDQQERYSASTVLYAPPVPFDSLTRYGYREVVSVIRRLRAPDGCPWDREQTHASLKMSLLEECYELLDAIDENDPAHLAEELGDVLMQVVMHAVIAEEHGRFTERDVSTGLVAKLVYRHPHVFGDGHADTAADVLNNWDKLKMAEKAQKTQTDVLNSVPRNLPALVRSKKVQKKAAAVGFDWPDAKSALPKIAEELRELTEAMEQNGNIDEEMGDLLFSVVNVSRLLHEDPELLLLRAVDKFIGRFAEMERLATADGKQLADLTFAEQDALWEIAKNARNEA